MRFNLHRLMLLSGGIILTWFIVSFLSMQEDQKIPIAQKDPAEIEFELSKLQLQMDHQLNETYSLLLKLKAFASKQQYAQINELGDTLEEPKSKSYNQHQTKKSPPVIPVLVIACNRITVQKSLDSLIRYRPSKEIFPIIVSQDCGHNATYKVIKRYADSDPSIRVVRQPDLSEIPRVKRSLAGYYKIARHFKFALDYVLVELFYSAVIVIEDDLDVSPDMFHYFLGTYPLLQEDPSIWCISAWNDNGKRDLIELSNPSLLHRTDFFPGLGWMLRRESWLELKPIWPKAYFDDWLRDPKNVKNRVCIRPEISRTYSFGKYGVSQGMFFDKHLKHIHLNEEFVDFTKLNLSYLLKKNYDKNLNELVASLPVAPAHIAAQATKDVKVLYRDEKTFKAAARRFQLMEDFRSGIARTAYRGVVSCYINNHRIYLAPDFKWTSYNSSWR